MVLAFPAMDNAAFPSMSLRTRASRFAEGPKGLEAHVIALQQQDLIAEVNRIAGGKGARMAFDLVGGPEVANISRPLSFLSIFFLDGALEGAEMPPCRDISTDAALYNLSKPTSGSIDRDTYHFCAQKF